MAQVFSPISALVAHIQFTIHSCRSAERRLAVKGGGATCKALDGQLALCYLYRIGSRIILLLSIRHLQRFHAHVTLYAPLRAGHMA